MQISRHWRMNSQRYRLEGVRYHNGDVSLQDRPAAAGNGGVEDEANTLQAEHRNRRKAAVHAA